MASPTVAARTENVDTTGVTNQTINFTQTTGDMVICFIAHASAVTLSSISDSFTDLVGGSANFHILYKNVLDGSEGGTVTYTQSSGVKTASIAYNIQGQSTTQAPEKSTLASNAGDTHPDPGTVTPTGGSKDYLWIAASREGGEDLDNDSLFTAAPTNFTNLTQKSTGTAGVVASNTAIGAADFASTASSIDPGTFTTFSSRSWDAYTVAVHPVPPATVKALSLLGVG